MDPNQPQPGPSPRDSATAGPGALGSTPLTGAPSQAPLPHRVILEQPFGSFRKILVIFLLLALGISVMFNFGLMGAYQSYIQSDPTINERLHSGLADASEKIAVINVKGAIMESESGFIKRQIDRVRKDDQVKAVVLRVDSPGGTVTASHYLYHHLKKLTKEKDIPLVVSMGSIAASGGYYISMAVGDAEDTIFAEETTWTGSVGVIIPSYDISGLLKDWNIVDVSYTSGELKQMGSPTRKPSELAKKKLKELVDESFDGFRDVVIYGRPKMTKDAMEEVKTGQIFTAKQAYRLGLVDKLGYVEDAIARAAELANLDPEKVRVVKYEKPPSLLNIALGGQAHAGAGALNLSALLDLTAPRAFYLSTWLPAVVSTQQGN